MVYAGWIIIQLFALTVPLYLLLHFGPVLSYLFSPHTLWLSTSLCLFLSFLFCRHAPSSEQRGHRGCGLHDPTVVGAGKRVLATFSVPLLLTLLTVWVMERGCVPCTTSPGFSPHGSLRRPTMVAHRGCSLDAPENSIAAFQEAIQLGQVGGLETDLSVSMDGVIFLLHDPHLIRTTDVRAKCPAHDPYANASMLYYHNGSCPLGQLSVGTRFVESASTELSEDAIAVYEDQRIPTFTQFLDVAKENDKVVIFDVIVPPVGHPYHHSFLNKTTQLITASGFPHSKVRTLVERWSVIEGPSTI